MSDQATKDVLAFDRRVLGRTGRLIHRLGVAASYGIGDRDLEAAVEEYGIDYLYWGSMRRAGFGRAVRSLVARGLRDRLFIVIQSYARLGFMVRWSLCRALRWLGIDHADLLLLGWWSKPVSRRILDAALACQAAGLATHVGVSTHQRPLVPGFAAASSPFAVVHFRYNAANRGAERDIFPHLARDGRAGLVAFTATRWGELLSRPPGAAADLAVPTAGDCYRFVLSHPDVDLCLAGPQTGDQLRDALRTLAKGAMAAEEMEWMRKVGDLVYHGGSLRSRAGESI